MTDRADVYKLSERLTGDKQAAVEKFLAPLDRAPLQGIDATKQVMHARAEQREAAAQLVGILNPVKHPEKDLRPTGRHGSSIEREARVPAALGKAAERALGKALDAVSNAFESLLAPAMTPEQQHEAALTARVRNAETDARIDLAQFLAERADDRQRQEQEREATRQRHRGERER